MKAGSIRVTLAGAAAAIFGTAAAPQALAWGNEGHRVVALIARQYLADHNSAALDRVEKILASDHDPLTEMDLASRATWPDRYRDTPEGRRLTASWHFIDIDVLGDPARPDLNSPCFDTPAAAAGPAFPASAQDCVIHKIEQFHKELASPSTDPQERARALRFMLHFIGDVHQPLHDAERNKDRGGNEIGIKVGTTQPVRLHGYWDDNAVSAWGSNENTASSRLYGTITPAQISAWRHGDAAAWALEGFSLARTKAYALPATPAGTFTPYKADHPIPYYAAPDGYKAEAKRVAGEQLQKAGVRLAWYLEDIVTP